MTSTHTAIMGMISPLLSCGYVVTVMFDADGIDYMKIDGGDCNCPHRKGYDPRDGHGHTHLEYDHFNSGYDDDPEYSLDIVRQMVDRAIELQGKEQP